MIFFIVFIVAIAFITAKVASSKGRSAGGWFVLGLCLPLLALLAVLVFPALSGLERGTHVRCPACKEPVLKGATICSHCRTNLAQYPNRIGAGEGRDSV